MNWWHFSRLHPAHAAVVYAVYLVLGLPSAPAMASTRWSQTYGGPGTFEGVLDLRELPGGSIIVAGHTDSYGTQTGDAWWIHLDAEGTVLEERTYGNGLPGGAADIAIDPDGGMAVVGAYTADIFLDRDAWIHHVDATGTVDWEWAFDADPGMHAFYAVAATADGGYIATGSTALSSTIPIRAWVVKLDSSGDVDWQQRYHGGVAEHANFVVQTRDGGYAIAGWTTSSGAGSTDVWLLKISSTGAIEWQKTYGGFDQEEATGLIQTADGGYAISAFTDTFSSSGHTAWVLRLDAAGGVIWHAVMGDVWSDFRNIAQTRDGDLIATGRLSGPVSNDLWAVKFRDADGAVLWQRAYEGTQGDWGSMAIELANDDLLIGGTWAWGFPEEDIWVQRTDRSGQIESCLLIRDTDILPTSPAITTRDATSIASDPDPVRTAMTFTANTSSLRINEKCRVVTGIEDPQGVSRPAGLMSIDPNPIQASATITFRMERPAVTRIRLYDVQGRLLETVADGTYGPGLHRLRWTLARREILPAGAYYLTFDTEGAQRAERVIILH